MAQRQTGSQPEVGGQPRIRQRRARRPGDVGVINTASHGELGLQLCRCGPQDARQCFDSLHIALTQGGGGKPGKLEQRFTRAGYAAQPFDARPQRLLRRRLGVLACECLTDPDRPAPFGLGGECQRRQTLPCGEAPGFAAQYSHVRQGARFGAQRAGQPCARGRQVISDDVREAGAYALAKGPWSMLEHVPQPVPPLLEHLCKQPLDVVPVIIESLEQQLDIRAELRIVLGGSQRQPRRPMTQLERPVCDDQRATCLRRDRKLARQPQVERIDRLNVQPAGILLEVPAAHGRVRQCGGSESA